MVTDIANSTEILELLLKEVGGVALWLQAIGIVALIWIIFSVVNWYLNRKRHKQLKAIREDLSRIEKKIDSLKKIKS